ncbi:hypothetical protein JCM11251_000391 [Rhodosporidiobolus azoricus]
MSKQDGSPPSSPSLLNVHLTTPKPSSSSLFPASSHSPSPSHLSSPVSSAFEASVPAEPKAKASKNSLFDASFAPILPPPPSSSGRSRSSTTESQYSTDGSVSSVSTGEGRSSRRSWMDVDSIKGESLPLTHSVSASLPPSISSSTLTPGVSSLALSNPPAEKTPLAHDSSRSSRTEYPWPLAPPSPFPVPSTPPISSSVLSLPPPVSPPRPSAPHRTSTYKPLSPTASTSSSSLAFPTLPASPSIQAGKSSNPLLDTRQSPLLRLSPTQPYLLGEGRHASVYLASYLPRGEAEGQVKAERKRIAGAGKGKRGWCLCAAKRLLPDRESQVGGLGEAFILAKLAPTAPSSSSRVEEAYPARGAANVIRLYGVRDERDGVEKPLPLPAKTPLVLSTSGAKETGLSRNGSTQRWDGEGGPKSPLKQSFGDGDGHGEDEYGQRDYGAAEQGLVLPPRSRKSSALSRRPRHSEPLERPSSETASGNGQHRPSLLSALEPPLSSSRRRVSSGGLTKRDPSPPPSPFSPSSRPPTSPSSGTASPTPSSRGRDGSQHAPTASDATSPEPRISLLLSYSPHGHLLQYARSHPAEISRSRWMSWARDLAGAVEWCHSRGVLHADLKPQNVLLSPTLAPLLSDFGSSLFLPPLSSPAHLFPTDPHGLGTLIYSPPEFVRALPSPFSYPADVFSLGVTLGVLLTSREPYEGLRTMERMVWVSNGEWWAWEERRRLAELAEEGEEEPSSYGGGEGDLSRQGSIRSVRSGRSSLRDSLRRRDRRDDSLESVKSWTSTPAGGWGQTPVRTFAWEELASSLLVDVEDGEEGNEKVVRAARETVLQRLSTEQSSRTGSPHHSRRPSASSVASAASLTLSSPSSAHAPSILYYPSTSTPLQYFLSFSPDDSPAPTPEDIVPLAVRELLRRMTAPVAKDRPTAREVRQELTGVAREEGVELVEAAQ